MMTKPLEGYRLLEFCHFIAGPAAGSLLADQGVEVIKVEPFAGDMLRSVGRERNGFSAPFITWNRNKSSIVLDLTSTDGQKVVHRLVEEADVIIHNFRPGVVSRLGIAEQILRAIKPDLIYVSITGFGPDGPYSLRPGIDYVVQGLSGLGSTQIKPDDLTPHMILAPVVDKLTGIVAAQAVTAALCARERTGKGSAIDVSMLDTAVSFAWGDAMGRETFVGDTGPATSLGEDFLCRTKDGFIICAVASDVHFAQLAGLVGRPDWLENPELSTSAGRTQGIKLFARELRGAFGDRTTVEWSKILENLGIPFAPLLTPDQVIDDPQVRHVGLVTESMHDVAGPLRECRSAALFDGEAMSPRRQAPALGESTDAVLAQAGYGKDEIQSLKRRGIAR